MSQNLNIDGSVFNHKRKDTVIVTNGKTIAENLDDGIKQEPDLKNSVFDESNHLYSGILIKVNGRFVHSNQLTTLVKDGDSIEILKYDG